MSDLEDRMIENTVAKQNIEERMKIDEHKSPLLDMLVANISPILLVVFSLSRLYHLQKVLILRKSKLFIFSFIDCVFGIVFKKVLPNPRTRRFIPIFL